jgi:hypothetical protein
MSLHSEDYSSINISAGLRFTLSKNVMPIDIRKIENLLSEKLTPLIKTLTDHTDHINKYLLDAIDNPEHEIYSLSHSEFMEKVVHARCKDYIDDIWYVIYITYSPLSDTETVVNYEQFQKIRNDKLKYQLHFIVDWYTEYCVIR